MHKQPFWSTYNNFRIDEDDFILGFNMHKQPFWPTFDQEKRVNYRNN